MTSFRTRLLTLMMFVLTAVPALAQEEVVVTSTVNPQASLGCLGVGMVALAAVGFIANARDAQGEQDPTIVPNPDDRTNVADIADVAGFRPSA